MAEDTPQVTYEKSKMELQPTPDTTDDDTLDVDNPDVDPSHRRAGEHQVDNICLVESGMIESSGDENSDTEGHDSDYPDGSQIDYYNEHEMDNDETKHPYPHTLCNDYITDHREYDCLPSEGKVDLAVFRVCRQFYFEANKAFWQNTTLSFEDPYSFSRFMEFRTTHQKKGLRNLHLELRLLETSNVGKWNAVFPITLVKSLVGLRVLHLHIRHQHALKFIYEEDEPLEWVEILRPLMFSPLLNLQVLPLTEVTVVWEQFWEYELDNPDDWSYERNREWAEFLRECLINPLGYKRWQEARDHEKAERQKMNQAMLAQKCQNVCYRTKAQCPDFMMQRAEERGKKLQKCIYRHKCDGCKAIDDIDGKYRHERECKYRNAELQKSGKALLLSTSTGT